MRSAIADRSGNEECKLAEFICRGVGGRGERLRVTMTILCHNATTTVDRRVKPAL